MLSILSILFTLAAAYQSPKESFEQVVVASGTTLNPKMYEAELPILEPFEDFSPDADADADTEPTRITTDLPSVVPEPVEAIEPDFSPFLGSDTTEDFATATEKSSGKRMGLDALVVVMLAL
jgi:hypothetical protein